MKVIVLLLFVAFLLAVFAVGGYLIERSEQEAKRRQQAKEKASRNNSDWQETYKLAYRLEYRKMLREEK